jgi:hypothetical protein
MGLDCTFISSNIKSEMCCVLSIWRRSLIQNNASYTGGIRQFLLTPTAERTGKFSVQKFQDISFDNTSSTAKVASINNISIIDKLRTESLVE